MFDATQFAWAAAPTSDLGGYHFEKNQVFFPFLPYVLRLLSSAFSDTQMLLTNCLYQLLISYANTILLYTVGRDLFGKPALAEVAAYAHIFSFSMVY